MPRRRRETILERGQRLIEEALQSGVDLLHDAQDEFRRLTPKELQRLGYSPKSRRYVKAKVKRPTKRTKSISHRKYETKRVKGISRETQAKLRRKGTLKFRTAQAKRDAERNRLRVEIRNMIHEVTPKDLRLIIKFREFGYHGLTSEEENSPIVYDEERDGIDEQERFRQLFKAYPRDEVLEAMGSPEIVVQKRAA